MTSAAMSGCERSEKTGLRMLGQIPRRPRTVRTTGVRWCLELFANSDPEALTRLPRKARQAPPVTTNWTSVIWEWERELARLVTHDGVHRIGRLVEMYV